MRSLALATTAGLLAGILSACGGTGKTPTRTVTVVSRSSTTASAPTDEVLSLSALGAFVGRCPRDAHSWTLRFVASPGAADTLRYRIGSGASRTTNVDPGKAVTFQLTPNATKSLEPPDRFVLPPGQGRGRSAVTRLPTTPPLEAVVSQGTEPQTLVANVRLALTTIGGESGRCVLASSAVSANTYPNSS